MRTTTVYRRTGQSERRVSCAPFRTPERSSRLDGQIWLLHSVVPNRRISYWKHFPIALIRLWLSFRSDLGRRIAIWLGMCVGQTNLLRSRQMTKLYTFKKKVFHEEVWSSTRQLSQLFNPNRFCWPSPLVGPFGAGIASFRSPVLNFRASSSTPLNELREKAVRFQHRATNWRSTSLFTESNETSLGKAADWTIQLSGIPALMKTIPLSTRQLAMQPE